MRGSGTIAPSGNDYVVPEGRQAWGRLEPLAERIGPGVPPQGWKRLDSKLTKANLSTSCSWDSPPAQIWT
jgi:hypothetical protein